MTKTKLALLVFCITFGLNGIAFFFSKKAFLVEEVKNVWLYELPLTASPLDSYGALDLGPQQGVIGTFFMPDYLVSDSAHPIQNLLADSWKWKAKERSLEILLKKSLVYANGDAIKESDWVNAHAFLVKHTPPFINSPAWFAWQQSVFQEIPGGIRIKLPKLAPDFDLEKFVSEVLTHPLSGVIHPKNLAALEKGLNLKKEWISSGPYTIWKWNPKEIEMVSRNDFPGGMQKGFFRTLKFQSAPVKNPSCDFMQGRPGDEKTLADHTVQQTNAVMHVFWICRSWREPSFCSSLKNRTILSELLSGARAPESNLLKGEKLRYRIPTGSDEFRTEIRSKIETLFTASGGAIEETSYFFKPSTETDLEISFVMTPDTDVAKDFATSLSRVSSRLGPGAMNEERLSGEIMSFPVNILMKKHRGEVYKSVFLEPDLDEKKLPL